MSDGADPIDRTGLRPRYWEDTPLSRMTRAEWEALCDGCGKCCLNKLEDDDTGEVALTRIACRLFDGATCRCRHYANRHAHVPECITLDPVTIARHLYWLPDSCAYKRLYRGEGLPRWHPLVTGDPDSVHAAGISVRGITLPETQVPEDDWEDHIIEENAGRRD